MNTHIPAHEFGTALPASRRSALVQLVLERGQATVWELAERFQVSPDTIRRDLDLLSRRGLLSRTYGGAVLAEPLVGAVVQALRDLGARAETGVFGADMKVSLVNDGPVTIIVDL